MKAHAIYAVVALAACAPQSDVVPLPPAEACGATAFDWLIGERFPGVDALRAADGPEIIRVIRPGDAVTMDYNPARMNVELDARDRVTRVYCG